MQIFYRWLSFMMSGAACGCLVAALVAPYILMMTQNISISETAMCNCLDVTEKVARLTQQAILIGALLGTTLGLIIAFFVSWKKKVKTTT